MSSKRQVTGSSQPLHGESPHLSTHKPYAVDSGSKDDIKFPSFVLFTEKVIALFLDKFKSLRGVALRHRNTYRSIVMVMSIVTALIIPLNIVSSYYLSYRKDPVGFFKRNSTYRYKKQFTGFMLFSWWMHKIGTLVWTIFSIVQLLLLTFSGPFSSHQIHQALDISGIVRQNAVSDSVEQSSSSGGQDGQSLRQARRGSAISITRRGSTPSAGEGTLTRLPLLTRQPTSLADAASADSFRRSGMLPGGFTVGGIHDVPPSIPEDDVTSMQSSPSSNVLTDTQPELHANPSIAPTIPLDTQQTQQQLSPELPAARQKLYEALALNRTSSIAHQPFSSIAGQPAMPHHFATLPTRRDTLVTLASNQPASMSRGASMRLTSTHQPDFLRMSSLLHPATGAFEESSRFINHPVPIHEHPRSITPLTPSGTQFLPGGLTYLPEANNIIIPSPDSSVHRDSGSATYDEVQADYLDVDDFDGDDLIFGSDDDDDDDELDNDMYEDSEDDLDDQNYEMNHHSTTAIGTDYHYIEEKHYTIHPHSHSPGHYLAQSHHHSQTSAPISIGSATAEQEDQPTTAAAPHTLSIDPETDIISTSSSSMTTHVVNTTVSHSSDQHIHAYTSSPRQHQPNTDDQQDQHGAAIPPQSKINLQSPARGQLRQDSRSTTASTAAISTGMSQQHYTSHHTTAIAAPSVSNSALISNDEESSSASYTQSVRDHIQHYKDQTRMTDNQDHQSLIRSFQRDLANAAVASRPPPHRNPPAALIGSSSVMSSSIQQPTFRYHHHQIAATSSSTHIADDSSEMEPLFSAIAEAQRESDHDLTNDRLQITQILSRPLRAVAPPSPSSSTASSTHQQHQQQPQQQSVPMNQRNLGSGPTRPGGHRRNRSTASDYMSLPPLSPHSSQRGREDSHPATTTTTSAMPATSSSSPSGQDTTSLPREALPAVGAAVTLQSAAVHTPDTTTPTQEAEKKQAVEAIQRLMSRQLHRFVGNIVSYSALVSSVFGGVVMLENDVRFTNLTQKFLWFALIMVMIFMPLLVLERAGVFGRRNESFHIFCGVMIMAPPISMTAQFLIYVALLSLRASDFYSWAFSLCFSFLIGMTSMIIFAFNAYFLRLDELAPQGFEMPPTPVQHTQQLDGSTQSGAAGMTTTTAMTTTTTTAMATTTTTSLHHPSSGFAYRTSSSSTQASFNSQSSTLSRPFHRGNGLGLTQRRPSQLSVTSISRAPSVSPTHTRLVPTH